ncbi:hypothetical protein [Flavobacterium gelatinilyticum]|uniref:hypothetical protein n=1 Tax=Flavobacterium gelatinilyticum TaxID=3003260 RepID=UPI0024800A83|nr:hypothetical protein [Flavobacterium gelatinilyticum]
MFHFIMQRVLTLLLFFAFSKVKSQDLADKIVISRITYVNQFDDYETEKVYKTEKKEIKSQKSISKLLSELKKSDDSTQLLQKFKIDIDYIKNSPDELLSLYKNENKITWNSQQMEYAYKLLKDLSLYSSLLKSYLANGCCYTMHNSYRAQFLIEVFKDDILMRTFRSRKAVWGFIMPYQDVSGSLNYNFEIDKEIDKIFKIKSKTKAPLEGTELLRYLVNKIIDNNMQELYKLSAYNYLTEINELKTDFEVLSFEEMYGRGRYIWNEPKTFKIRLKSKEMFPNVYLNFLASKTGKSIYSRDSIKSDYKEIVKRVQSVKFIKDYLSSNPTTILDIYYFNNSGINAYNIDGVNKNPMQWKKQDDYIKSLEWEKEHGINSTFDVNKAVKTAERNNCGCNYRFSQGFIEKAIFFELTDESKNENSIWFLLPDDTVLLYIMSGQKVLYHSYSEFGEYTGIQYPCVLFDTDGKSINKK